MRAERSGCLLVGTVNTAVILNINCKINVNV